MEKELTTHEIMAQKRAALEKSFAQFGVLTNISQGLGIMSSDEANIVKQIIEKK